MVSESWEGKMVAVFRAVKIESNFRSLIRFCFLDWSNQKHCNCSLRGDEDNLNHWFIFILPNRIMASDWLNDSDWSNQKNWDFSLVSESWEGRMVDRFLPLEQLNRVQLLEG